jgi:hypothetical protein
VRTGVIPVAILSFLDALQSSDKFNAKMLLSGATVFERNHPLAIAIGEAQDMTPRQLDDFFRAAAEL